MIRTRFAPSPTGHLHVGGARTALYAWIFAKQKRGEFVLRIEDTDRQRSTEQSVAGITEAMKWLGLMPDSQPVFQSKRLKRYQEVADHLIKTDQAYWCYCTPEELSELRLEQKNKGLKPRYDGRWRPENLKIKTIPNGIKPVLRFKNPLTGTVRWNDLVKGPIEIANAELDDLVILRSDGTPTYNFGVVVDDADMQISHVIRGDDHVNNTPRQINIFKALDYSNPHFAHLPMILGQDGERLSKRHGAVSVLEFKKAGYLPSAFLNYVARLGWGRGDAEKFTITELVKWFSLEGVSKAPARFDTEKLDWLNKLYIKETSDDELAGGVCRIFIEWGRDVDTRDPSIVGLIALLKDRATLLTDLAKATMKFYQYSFPSEEMINQYFSKDIVASLEYLRKELASIEWKKDEIGGLLKSTAKKYKKKFPEIAMPLRLIVMGTTDTPALNATLEILGRSRVCKRIDDQMPRLKRL